MELYILLTSLHKNTVGDHEGLPVDTSRKRIVTSMAAGVRMINIPAWQMHGFAADLYAFGVLLVMMLTGGEAGGKSLREMRCYASTFLSLFVKWPELSNAEPHFGCSGLPRRQGSTF